MAQRPGGLGWLPVRAGMAWAGYAAAGCVLLRLPAHLYAGLVAGSVGGRVAHLVAAVVLLTVAGLAVALVHPAGRRLPSAVLIVPAFVACVGVLGYAARTLVAGVRAAAAAISPDLPARLTDTMAVLHPSRLEQAAVDHAQWLGDPPLPAYPLMSLTGAVPWALALGLLLALAAAHRLGGPTARRIWYVVVGLAVLRLLT